jgi:hypothetical protein
MAKGTPLTARGCAARVGGGGGCSGGRLADDVGGSGEDMVEDDSFAWSSVDTEGCEPVPSWSSCGAELGLAEGDVGGEIVESGKLVGESCAVATSCVGSDGAGGSGVVSSAMSSSMLLSWTVMYTPAPAVVSTMPALLAGRSLLPGVMPGATE